MFFWALLLIWALLSKLLHVVQRSQRVGEEGIGALFGEPNTNIMAAAGSIRAWRPVQVSPPAAF